MEAKAIDGHENASSVILSNKIYEVQKYLSITNHVYASNIILFSKKTWDKLTPVKQKILQDAAYEARDYQRAASREIAGKAVGELRSRGMQVNEVSPPELARMRQTVQPVLDKFAPEYDQGVVRLFRQELERVHSM
ncbi:TRAP transporter substrate-binding protein DctP [Aquincola agrisoli]